MNLQQLIAATLTELRRPDDDASLEAFGPRITGYINEGIIDLCMSYQPTAMQEVVISDGRIDLDALSKPCVKALRLTIGGTDVRFCYALAANTLITDAVNEGTGVLYYRYGIPALLHAEDVPELPDELTQLLVCYAAAREQMSGGTAAASGAKLGLGLYESMKRRICSDLDGERVRNIFNRY